MGRSKITQTSTSSAKKAKVGNGRTSSNRASHLQRAMPEFKSTLCTTTSERTKTRTRENMNRLLEEILKVDDELRTWLEYTGYFDPENRKRILDKAKTRRELDQRRAEFLAQVQSATIHALPAPMSLVQQELPPLRYRRSRRFSGATSRPRRAIRAET
ncbi:hypothetical protein CI102_5565 [Trichoderma harzianum]|uniref:Uncharacterized protein n=1 Tax=Trichoderma harzianum CBS 226.95 TaxID=983964 RepID=A0A2T3ZV84_TRIHA|nr:hypothetical protein M431DRAFT_487444 [Trichoderma harzianum CBS 226.95]PKK49131.1 hypothetical protein CI102_5565 [Trichoderma harzianum]PTB48721.1 hypothetical protein M431DRAFT_487444 [Trichoderma harzianum CBS 226.95]